MQTDETLPGMSGPHPTIAELRDQSHPNIASHLETCSMCRAIVAAEDDVPIALDLPKGLVSETAFRWPADAMARGGMAQIFLGEDRRLGRTVILKAPREGDDLPAGMADMFQRRVSAEARILAKLQHPSIVTIYELGRASVGWPFCVLEKVEGTSLRDRLDELADQEASDGVPRTRERVELLSNLVAIAEALAYAHERRVVHRDCTPNNILLGKRGEATLIDWGIARDLDAPAVGNDASIHDQPPSMSGRMVTISAGTPPYLPLEQSQGRKADPSFDVYSFGITLYEVVSGRTPFEWKSADGPGARTAQVEAFIDWLQSEHDVAPAMPRDKELSGIIARSMAKEPSDRFTADELVRALKQYLTGDLVFSHRYSITGRLARWARTHKAASLSMLFLVASAVAGALVWAQISRQAKEEAELRTIAASARATASEAQNEADQAGREAELAKARAEQAEREGKSSQQLRIEADAKRKAADAKRKAAEEAATQAKGTADEAVKKFQEAMKVKDEAERERDQANAARDMAKGAQTQAERERDAARASQSAAEKEREAARQSRDAADRERDAAKQTAAAAQADRDAAKAAREAADRERDAARAAASAAEKEREAAISARAAIERERDDAKRKVAELEARLRDQQQPPPSPPSPPPPSPTP
jgi:tRNA A-37 threonylcarbamoyl transferase component Bud32